MNDDGAPILDTISALRQEVKDLKASRESLQLVLDAIVASPWTGVKIHHYGHITEEVMYLARKLATPRQA